MKIHSFHKDDLCVHSRVGSAVHSSCNEFLPVHSNVVIIYLRHRQVLVSAFEMCTVGSVPLCTFSRFYFEVSNFMLNFAAEF